MTNKLKLPAESRMQGDLQVRFGGRSGKTYRRKAERRPVVPSLQSREERERILYKNFIQVGQDVKDMITDVLNKRGAK